MKKKRSNTFETNSSSVHTITLDGRAENDLKVERDGYVHLRVRSYGKNYAAYHGAEDKLMYAILIVCYTHGIWLSWDYDYIDERHWLPGEGDIPWYDLYKTLLEVGYTGAWMYEISPKCPKTILRDRDLTCADFARNANEIFTGKPLTVFSQRIDLNA